MLGISLPELLITACVILVVVRPADLPILAKYYKIAAKKIMSLKQELYELCGLAPDSLLDKEEKKFVMGDDGKVYEAFDVTELKPIHQPTHKKTRT